MIYFSKKKFNSIQHQNKEKKAHFNNNKTNLSFKTNRLRQIKFYQDMEFLEETLKVQFQQHLLRNDKKIRKNRKNKSKNWLKH